MQEGGCMAKLHLDNCEVTLNLGVNECLESELEKIFPQTRPAGGCSLCASYDLSEEVLYIDMDYDIEGAFKKENLLMISIDGLENIDALRRYCEMVLDHHKAAEERDRREKISL
jgi:hypothetical protein